MQNPVEIVLRGIPQSSALERYVGEQARTLERMCGSALSCRVVAEALHRPQQGTQFAVRLNIGLPGTEVVVNREHDADVYIALRAAFEAAGLQLKEHMRRQHRGEHRSRNRAPHPGS